MFKNKKTIYIILIIIFSVILFLEKKQFDSNIAGLEADEKASLQETAKNSATTSTAKKVAESDSTTTSSEPTHTDTPDSLKKFAAWVHAEAANLEQSTNQKAKETELKAAAHMMTAGEINLLKQKSVSTEATANERIFSTYMLTLGDEQATTTSLLEVAKQNLSLPSPQPTHSLGETTLMQEKALRTMAIDELFSRASANPNLRGDFLQMANQIQDPGLKKYALRRYDEFK